MEGNEFELLMHSIYTLGIFFKIASTTGHGTSFVEEGRFAIIKVNCKYVSYSFGFSERLEVLQVEG